MPLKWLAAASKSLKDLVAKINNLIPDAKVITISQIVDTQVRTNQLMKSLSTLFLVIIIAIGGASIANDMYNNVYERKKEIGTLVALGANSSMVLKVFLLKALVLGIIGGIGGYIIRHFLAIILGPLVAGVPVLPLWYLFPCIFSAFNCYYTHSELFSCTICNPS